MATSPAELTMTIEPGSDPISGWIRFGDDPPMRFHGYIQLISALELARDGNDEAGDPRGDPPRSDDDGAAGS